MCAWSEARGVGREWDIPEKEVGRSGDCLENGVTLRGWSRAGRVDVVRHTVKGVEGDACSLDSILSHEVWSADHPCKTTA